MSAKTDSAPAKLATIDEALAPVWEAFRRGCSPQDRNRLVVAYSPLVKFVAARLASGRNLVVEMEDLIGYGMLGLIDAVERFEPERGLRFSTYAGHRIRGAILDELRRLDWAPRRVRQRARVADNACETLTQELGRSPDEQEVTSRLGESARRARAEAAAATVLRLDTPDADGNTIDSMIGDSDPGIAAVDQRDLAAWLLESLGPRDRQIVSLYFFEELSLVEIGTLLDITESRVCQLLTRIKKRLAARGAGADALCASPDDSYSSGRPLAAAI